MTGLAEARAQAEAGMTQALQHAEAVVPSWGDQALAFLKSYAERNQCFTAWLVTRCAELHKDFPAPPTGKAWGAIFKRAAYLGYIRRTGYAPDPNRHASPCPVWTSLIYGMTAVDVTA